MSGAAVPRSWRWECYAFFSCLVDFFNIFSGILVQLVHALRAVAVSPNCPIVHRTGSVTGPRLLAGPKGARNPERWRGSSRGFALGAGGLTDRLSGVIGGRQGGRAALGQWNGRLEEEGGENPITATIQVVGLCRTVACIALLTDPRAAFQH